MRKGLIGALIAASLGCAGEPMTASTPSLGRTQLGAAAPACRRPGAGGGRWYAIGRTTTADDNGWLGAKVEWEKRGLTVHPAEPNNTFILQDLWVTTYGKDSNCWIETGDSRGDSTDRTARTYFYAMNSPSGYGESNVRGITYPADGAYQSYEISWWESGGWALWRAYIAGRLLVNVLHAGPTNRADSGIESCANRNTAERTAFRNFKVRTRAGAWVDWPDPTRRQDAPGRFEWTEGNTAWNSMIPP